MRRGEGDRDRDRARRVGAPTHSATRRVGGRPALRLAKKPETDASPVVGAIASRCCGLGRAAGPSRARFSISTGAQVGPPTRLVAECVGAQRAGRDLGPGLLHLSACKPSAAVALGAARPLAAGGCRLWIPWQVLASIKQDRIQLRPEHGAELRRGGGLDAVHAFDLVALGRRRRRRRDRRSVERNRRCVCRRSLPRRRRAARPTFPAASSPTTTRIGTWREVLDLRPGLRSGRDHADRRPAEIQAKLDGARREVVHANEQSSRRRTRSGSCRRFPRGCMHEWTLPRCSRSPRRRAACGSLRRERRFGPRCHRSGPRTTGAGAVLARQRKPNRPGPVIRTGRGDADGSGLPITTTTSSPSRGGPQLVSVAHTHHDYPAADIAAPEGSPVYAISNAVVLNALAHGRPSLRHRHDDPHTGRPRVDVIATWLFLEPSVVDGVSPRPERRSGSSARPGTQPDLTSTCSCNRRPNSRRTNPVPELRRQRIHVARRTHTARIARRHPESAPGSLDRP